MVEELLNMGKHSQLQRYQIPPSPLKTGRHRVEQSLVGSEKQEGDVGNVGLTDTSGTTAYLQGN